MTGAATPLCSLCHKPMVWGYHAFGRIWMCNPCGIFKLPEPEAEQERQS